MTYYQPSHYTTAAACRRGHLYAANINTAPAASRCSECGAAILQACPSCNAPLRGNLIEPMTMRVGKYEPDSFCYSCGSPYPWAGRDARIYELQNLLDEEVLDEATRLSVTEFLEALRDPDLSEEQQAERWVKVKKLAPGLLASGQRIIESIVTAAIKAQLGLP